MLIKIGHKYINKTWRFLFPCLRAHGDVFVTKFNPLFKLAVGVSDSTLSNTIYSKERNIFMLIDTLHQPKCVQDFMSWIVYQPYYKHHYFVDNYEMTESRKMMLVISVPEDFNDAYDKFIDGKYSEMYEPEVVNKLFNKPTRQNEFNILSKSPSLHQPFIEFINKEFNTNIGCFDEPVKEYELPLKPFEEIFNYNLNNYYLIKELDKV